MSHFLLGFTIGTVIGAAAVAIGSPRSGAALRRALGELVQETLDTARQASAAREQELWSEFRTRLSTR